MIELKSFSEHLDNEFTRLLEGFAALEIRERTARSNTEKQYFASKQNSDWLNKNGLHQGDKAHDNMLFRSLSDGDYVCYATRSRSGEQIRDDMVVYLNKQNQWILAEAYELFKDFIDAVYAVGEELQPGLWKPCQLSRIANPSLSKPTFQSLLDAASDANATGDCSTKLNRFRLTFPTLRLAELASPLASDPKLMIVLIELLRHVIVHNGGRVKSKDSFISRLQRKTGTLNNGVPSQSLVADVESYLGERDGLTHVVLLDGRPSDLPFGYTSRIGQLTNILLAYAGFIHTELLLPLTAK